MDHVTRFHLKTDCDDRSELIDFCLNGDKQFLVIGWSNVHEKGKEIKSFEDFYYAVKEEVSRINHAFNVFRNASVGDLLWTRDLEGSYWICRVIDKARAKYDGSMDIGAVLPVEAFKVGMQVPGQIKASFNRPLGGIAGGLCDNIIIEYSKYIYNTLSGTEEYEYERLEGSILDNLPSFELEELVISYLQIVKDYYVLSNSIANKSTTIKIECELMNRDVINKKKAVVQVKGGKTSSIDAISYMPYVDDGYEVYLFAPVIDNIDVVPNCYEISEESLLDFYVKYKEILPESITRWERLFG